MHEGRILDRGEMDAFRERLPGLTVRVVTAARRQVAAALWDLKPLDLFGEGEVIRARFPEAGRPQAALLAAIQAIPGVERAERSEASLEDFFLHTLFEAEAGAPGGVHG
jgi:hypothetical protein